MKTKGQVFKRYNAPASADILTNKNLKIMEKQNELKDSYNFVFWIVFLIGFTILLPWNILITVEGFWQYKFRNLNISQNSTESETDEELTDLQKLFGSYVAIASNVPNATFVVLHAIIGHKIPMKWRLYGSQVRKNILSYLVK